MYVQTFYIAYVRKKSFISGSQLGYVLYRTVQGTFCIEDTLRQPYTLTGLIWLYLTPNKA